MQIIALITMTSRENILNSLKLISVLKKIWIAQHSSSYGELTVIPVYLGTHLGPKIARSANLLIALEYIYWGMKQVYPW